MYKQSHPQVHMDIDSTDEHKDVLDEVTVTKVRWWVKGSAMPNGDTEVIQYE